jgi:hypothetical protein
MAQQPQPKRGAAFTVVFPILDADGDLVTGAAGLDSEVSKDLGGFADCTNEATEIATASGIYYLTLTATEMTADIVAIIVKTSTSGAKTTPIVLYPATRDTNDLSYHDDPDPNGYIDAAVSSRAPEAAGNVAAIKAKTDKLTFNASNEVAAAINNAAAFAQAAADKVWDTAARTLTSFGTLAADVWGYATRVITGLSTAAKAEVNAEADTALADYDPPTKAELDAGFAALENPTVTEIADGVLSRAISNVEGSATFRSLAGAVAKLVNKVAIAGSTLTVYKTNDTSAMGTQEITTDEAAKPIVAVDTA